MVLEFDLSGYSHIALLLWFHRTFSLKDLKNYYHTPERILEHKEMIKFAKWIAKRPIDYKDKLKHTNEIKNKRK